MPPPAAKHPNRLTRPTLSIRQLTFGGFFLVLAVIVTTGIVSMLALRRIDNTFAELQRLQSIGDTAEDIDRNITAARPLMYEGVIGYGITAGGISQAASRLDDLLRSTDLQLNIWQQGLVDDGLKQLRNYRATLESLGHLENERNQVGSALAALRLQFHTTVEASRDRDKLAAFADTWDSLFSAIRARDAVAARDFAARLRDVGWSDPPARQAADAYAASIDRLSAIDEEMAGRESMLARDRSEIERVMRLLREQSNERGRELGLEFARTLGAARWRGILLNGGAVLIGILAAWYVVHRTVRPLTSIASSIRSLASGAPDVTVPATELRNEVGDIARASEVFRRTLVEADAAREAAVRALAERRLAEEGYRKLFEGSVDGIYVTTPNGRLLDANPALARMMGYDSARQLIESVPDVAHDVYADPAARTDYHTRMMREGTVRDFEYEVRRRNGDRLWLSDSATAVRDAEGQMVRFEGTVRDITDQRRAEEAVAESRRLLQQVIDTVPAVINVKTPDLRYVLMNRYMAGIFSIDQRDAIGRTTSELMSRYGAEKTDANDRRVLVSRAGLGFYEEQYQDASGAMRQWLVNKLPLLNADGEVESIVTVALDIGERKRNEQAMQAAKDEAEAALRDLRETQNSLIEAEKLAALGRLVAGVAHEVNNPVGISLTVASSLQRKIERFADEVERGELRRSSLNEFVAANLDAAQQLVANLNRAAELVQSFKQVAADRNYSDKRAFDLADLTEQVVMSLKPGLRKRQVSLTVDCAPGILMDSYPGPYGQVLTNLFLNAVAHAFADGGGNVTITARPAGEHHAQIVFADDGRGMTADVRRRAFDPFFTTRRDSGGTGLGLHIVYSIVTSRLGGRIVLQSSPEEGTRIEMTLPRNAPLEQAAE